MKQEITIYDEINKATESSTMKINCALLLADRQDLLNKRYPNKKSLSNAKCKANKILRTLPLEFEMLPLYSLSEEVILNAESDCHCMVQCCIMDYEASWYPNKDGLTKINQSVLADLTGLARQTVNIITNKLKAAGKLIKRGYTKLTQYGMRKVACGFKTLLWRTIPKTYRKKVKVAYKTKNTNRNINFNCGSKTNNHIQKELYKTLPIDRVAPNPSNNLFDNFFDVFKIA